MQYSMMIRRISGNCRTTLRPVAVTIGLVEVDGAHVVLSWESTVSGRKVFASAQAARCITREAALHEFRRQDHDRRLGLYGVARVPRTHHQHVDSSQPLIEGDRASPTLSDLVDHAMRAEVYHPSAA